jgi:hypothetical protein
MIPQGAPWMSADFVQRAGEAIEMTGDPVATASDVAPTADRASAIEALAP